MRFVSVALLLLGMGLASYDIFIDRAQAPEASAPTEQVGGDVQKAEDGTPWPKP